MCVKETTVKKNKEKKKKIGFQDKNLDDSQIHVGWFEIYPYGSFDAFVSSWVATSCM